MKKIICKINGHKLNNLDTRVNLIEEFTCSICNQKFTTDGYGQLVILNAFWKENNLLFKKILVKS